VGYDVRGSWPRWNKKQTVEESLSLSPAPLADGLNRAMEEPVDYEGAVWQGTLHWSNVATGEEKSSIGYIIERRGDRCLVRLQYRRTGRGEEQKMDYRVPMTYTVPNFGGRRWWFICPLVVNDRKCGRRIGKLHLPPGARYFGCRHCHDLTYESTRKNDRSDRIDRRLWAIRRKLASRGSVRDPLPDKPKGMHWTTYSSLANEYLNLQELRNAAFIYEAVKIMGGGPFADSGSLPSLSAAEEELDWLWQDYQDCPDRPGYTRRENYRKALEAMRLEGEAEERPPRATLGEIARAAGVPYEFAKEAQANGLIRPDGERGTRRKRYRLKLASWLKKLHALNDAGYSWEALRIWTRWRFQPGHEHERRWPEGFEESLSETS
jgi:hypothetical protein